MKDCLGFSALMAVTAEPVRLAKVSAEPQRLSENGAKAKPTSPSLDDFVGELLQRIQPAPASEARRKTVAEYVQSVIAKAFSPQFQVMLRDYTQRMLLVCNLLLIQKARLLADHAHGRICPSLVIVTGVLCN